jgi:hypothetical protein
MSETGENLEEASTNATKPINEQSSLNTGYFSAATGTWDDPTSTFQPGVEIQEGPSLEYHPPLVQSSSYFSLSSGSSAALSAPANAKIAVNKSVIDNPGVVTPGNEIQEGRNTIESSAKIPPIPPRKDSDDISLSKIKPVHNFFGQHPYTPYDSDGSDGSLVFSPGSVTDDHKAYVPSDKMPSDKKDGSYSGGTSATTNTIGKRNDSTMPTSSRTRIGSVDSVASNGSIRYVRPSPVNASANIDAKQSNGQSQPVNPQLLPYNERRKLIQQRQYQEQHQQYQQYHAAMMKAHSQASQQQQQQGHPSHPSASQFPIDPRMAGNYYQMYGMPPPGMYAPLPPHHNQHQSAGVPPVNGYPFLPPIPAMPYYHMPNSTGPSHDPSHTQLHPSIHQFQHQSSTTGYQQQSYPSPLLNSHQVPPPLPSPYQNNNNNPSMIPPAASPHPSMPPQYAYLPPPPPPLSSNDSPEQRAKQIHRYEESPKPPQLHPGAHLTLDRSRNSGKDAESNTGVDVSIGGNSAQLSTKNANVKNNLPRLPPTATRRGSGSNSGFNRDVGSSNSIPPPSIPPPTPPLSSPKSHLMSLSGAPSSYHSRADSYGSMSSLGSQGFGSGSFSFSKDEDDDYPQIYAQSSQQHPETQQSMGIDNQKDSNSATLSTPKPNRPTIDTSIAMNAPETPRRSSHERKNSFLDMLRMNWSPQSRNSPTSSSRQVLKVSEFHRKNQEFLNRATTLPPMQKSPTAASIPTMHHRRIGSQDRPPASRGTHRRLQSISNDEWDEGDDDKSSDNNYSAGINKQMPTLSDDFERKQSPAITNTFKSSESDGMSESETFTDDDRCTTDDDVRDHDDYENVNEFSSLLPRSGISSNEQEGKNSKHDRKSRRGRQHYEATSSTQILGNTSVSDSSANVPRMSDTTVPWDNRTANMARKGRKKKYRHKNSKYAPDSDSSSENSQDSSDSDFDQRKWTKKKARVFEKERAKLIDQWKAEAREEAELLRKEEETNRWYRRMWSTTSEQFRHFGVTIFRCLILVETFIGNLPLTIGAVALAIVTLGVVWFKFAEEYLDSCQPVHFHSSQCTFPEFPGCFYCDKSALGYKIAIGFHYACTMFSGLLAMLLVAKVLLATRVVIDEMSSPTTSSPAGLLCMTSVCVFAGRGMVGQVIVSTAACFHLALAIWFIYMALAYNIMPEPSWFPNTIGIGISAVKVKHPSTFVFRLHDTIDPHHRLPCRLVIHRNNLSRRPGCIIQCEFNVFLFLL